MFSERPFDRWWQRGVIYQVYPRSFADSNADGVGDLRGIIGRIDYFVQLGIDAVWLSPIYPSPMADFGYDVSDYCGVDPLFGTLADFDELAAALHARGIALVLDFVPNHTSDRHPWFVASRSSCSDPKRDWYLWRAPATVDGPPNNWRSHFGGPAWTLDEKTGEYYLHSFLPEQPDLNWRNPAVRTAMYDALRFWLDRGVDGFRVDVLWLLIKDAGFRDDPPELTTYSADRPEVHEIVREMRAVVDAYSGDRVIIGEIYLPIDRLVTYYGARLDEAQMPFNFSLLLAPWRAEALAEAIRTYETALPSGAWPNYVLGNHDKPRLATRVGSEQARVAAMLLLTLRGTPTLYYGDELGMRDVPIPADRVRDPAELRQPEIGAGRDPERTPMQWDASPGRGFSSAEPWLPFGDDVDIDVATLEHDPASLLVLYRALLTLRRSRPLLINGSLHDVRAEAGVLFYRRRDESNELLIVLNLTGDERVVAVPDVRLILSTRIERILASARDTLCLAPSEGLVLEVVDRLTGA